jgi:hypothetical protein
MVSRKLGELTGDPDNPLNLKEAAKIVSEKLDEIISLMLDNGKTHYIPAESGTDSGSGSGSGSGSSEPVLEGNKVLCKYNVSNPGSTVILYHQDSGSGSG